MLRLIMMLIFFILTLISQTVFASQYKQAEYTQDQIGDMISRNPNFFNGGGFLYNTDKNTRQFWNRMGYDEKVNSAIFRREVLRYVIDTYKKCDVNPREEGVDQSTCDSVKAKVEAEFKSLDGAKLALGKQWDELCVMANFPGAAFDQLGEDMANIFAVAGSNAGTRPSTTSPISKPPTHVQPVAPTASAKSYAEKLCSDDTIKRAAGSLTDDQISQANIAFDIEVDRRLSASLGKVKKDSPDKIEIVKKSETGNTLWDSGEYYKDTGFSKDDRYYLITSDEFAPSFFAKMSDQDKSTYAPVYCSRWAWENQKSNAIAKSLMVAPAVAGIAGGFKGYGTIMAGGTSIGAYMAASSEAKRALSLKKWATVGAVSNEYALATVQKADTSVALSQATGVSALASIGLGAVGRFFSRGSAIPTKPTTIKEPLKLPAGKAQPLQLPAGKPQVPQLPAGEVPPLQLSPGNPLVKQLVAPKPPTLPPPATAPKLLASGPKPSVNASGIGSGAIPNAGWSSITGRRIIGNLNNTKGSAKPRIERGLALFKNIGFNPETSNIQTLQKLRITLGKMYHADICPNCTQEMSNINEAFQFLKSFY